MMDYQAQRRYYRAQRRAFRRQMRGNYGGFGLIWLIVIAILAVTHLWQLSILVFFALPLFFFVLRPILSGTANAMNHQQYSQPRQEQPLYQQPYQQEQPVYQPYTQGYGERHPPVQQSEISQQGEQQDQYPVQQTQQYEEPLAIYQQE